MSDEDDGAPDDAVEPRRVRETKELPKIQAGFLHSFRRGGELIIPVALIHELRLRHIEHAQPPTSYWAVFANDRLIHAHDDHDPVREIFEGRTIGCSMSVPPRPLAFPFSFPTKESP